MGRGIDSRNRVWNWLAKLYRMAGRYDNPMPTWFLAPISGTKVTDTVHSMYCIMYTPSRREIITVRGQSFVSRLPNIDPPSPSPPGECVPPAFVGGGGQTRRAERGMGGQYFGRRETKDCPLTEIISLRYNVIKGVGPSTTSAWPGWKQPWYFSEDGHGTTRNWPYWQELQGYPVQHCPSGSFRFWEGPVGRCEWNSVKGIPQTLFLNVYGAPELIPRNEFRQPM
jgi:hypothetical protein